MRPATRKVLTFDAEAGLPLVVGAWLALFGAVAVGRALAALGAGFRWWEIALAVGAGLVGTAGPSMCAVAAADRVNRLRAVVGRSIAVPARVVSATRDVGLRASAGFRLSVEYGYGGATRHATLIHSALERDLLGGTPDLLVDAAAPDNVLPKDFYV
jgi:hypothetical protein